MRMLADILTDNDWKNATRFVIAVIGALSTAGFLMQRRTSKQFVNNSGTTIKDQIDRIEQQNLQIIEHQAAVKQRLEAVEAAQKAKINATQKEEEVHGSTGN